MIWTCIALAWLAIFPPDSIQPVSWIGPLLLTAACFDSRVRSRFGRDHFALGISIALVLGINFLAHGLQCISSLPIALLILIAFSLGNRVNADSSRRMLAYTFSISILVEGIIALSQRWMGVPPALAESFMAMRLQQHRVWGSFVTANILAAWLLCVLPFLAMEFWNEQSKRNKLFFGGALVLGSGLLWWSASGGALLAFAASLCLGLALIWKKISFRNRGIGILLILGLGTALTVLLALRGFTIFQPDSGQDLLYDRLILWVPALDAIRQAFWFGFGPAFSESAYRTAQAARGFGFGAFPHQMILSLGLSYGMCGICIVLVWIFSYGSRLCSLLRIDGAKWRWGVAFALAGVFFQAQWEMSLQQVSILLTVAFIAGLAVAPKPFKPLPVVDDFQSLSPSPRMPSFWVVCTCLALALFFHGGLAPWQWIACSSFLLLFWMFFGPLKLPDFGEPASVALLLFMGWMVACVVKGFSPEKGCLEMVPLACGFLCWCALRSEIAVSFRRVGELWVALACICTALIFARGLWIGSSWFESTAASLGMAIPVEAVRFLYPNQNLFAGSVVVPAILFCLAEAWHGTRRILALLAIVWLSLMLSYCGSRGAFLGLFLGILWITLRTLKLSPEKRGRIIVAAFATLVFFGVAMLAPESTLMTRFHHQETASTADPYINFRAQIWMKSFELTKERPIFGWGPASFRDAIQTCDLPTPVLGAYSIVKYRLIAEHAHNEWLEFASETGWPGLVLLGALLIWFFVGLYLRVPTSGRMVFLEAAVMVILVQASVDFNLHCPSILALLCLMLAVILPARQVRSIDFLGRLGGAAIFSLALCFALQIWLIKESRVRGSTAHLQAALNPVSAGAVMDEATMLLNSQGQNEDDGKIMRLASQAVSMEPNSAGIQFDAALVLHQEMLRCPEARLALLGPLWSDWVNLSVENVKASAAQKVQELSELSIERAIALHPFDARLDLSSAYLALDGGDLGRAKRFVAQAVVIEPNFAAAWELEAQLARSSGDRKTFLNALKRLHAIEKIPVEPGDLLSTQMKSADWESIDKLIAMQGKSLS